MNGSDNRADGPMEKIMPMEYANEEARRRATGVESAPCSSRCSIAPHVPNLPPEAIEFAEAVGQLCEKYSIRNLAMEVEVDRFTRDHQYREDIVSDMSITVSTMDGRGRPRKRINVRAKLHVSVPIIWEPDSLS